MESPPLSRVPAGPLDRDLPLARIALRSEAEARVLASDGLSFWRNGHRSLLEACRDLGREVEGVEVKLQAARAPGSPPPRDWWTVSLDEVLARVVDGHHAFARAMLSRLEEAVSRVVARHAHAHPELVVVEHLVAALHDDLIPHFAREEQVLFPFIRQTRASSADLSSAPDPAHPTRTMLAQHTGTAELLDELVEATDRFDPPPTASAPYVLLYRDLAALRDDLLLHITLEESVLFPRALAVNAPGP